VRFGTLADLTILRRIAASDVMKLAAPVVRPEEPLQKLIDIAGETEAVDFVVVDDDSVYQGMVMGKDLRTALLQPEAVSLLLVGELMRPGVPTVHPGETLDAVLDKFARSEVDSLPLCNETDSTQIDGLVTRHAVMRRYHQELDRQAG
jgi:CBS domain-containing protein